jgi:hypothetical protein
MAIVARLKNQFKKKIIINKVIKILIYIYNLIFKLISSKQCCIKTVSEFISLFIYYYFIYQLFGV